MFRTFFCKIQSCVYKNQKQIMKPKVEQSNTKHNYKTLYYSAISCSMHSFKSIILLKK